MTRMSYFTAILKPADYATAIYEYMSPTLLAEQPAAIPEESFKPDADWDTLYNHLESRLLALRAWRWS